MKKEIHPNYREVVFLDVSIDYSFMTKSTVRTSDTIKWKDGKDYPLYKLDTSSEFTRFTLEPKKWLILRVVWKNLDKNSDQKKVPKLNRKTKDTVETLVSLVG